GIRTRSEALAIARPPRSACAGPSSSTRSKRSASRIARSTVLNFSTGISGCRPARSRRVFHLVEVPWAVSRSAIFTVHPARMNSTAKSRARADFPTPPFWETKEMIMGYKPSLLGIAEPNNPRIACPSGAHELDRQEPGQGRFSDAALLGNQRDDHGLET